MAEGAFSRLVPSTDTKKVFYAQDDEIYEMELSGEKKKTKVAFAVTVTVDHRGEWGRCSTSAGA